ncbi:MAG: helicase-related protein [Chloroflexota bacterium]
MKATPGSLVKYREREWVVLPSENPEVVVLRPIGGSVRETCAVLKSFSDLIGASLPYERLQEAAFPLPDPGNAQDHIAVRLVMQAARLLLREGAAPFRSLGHLSFRPHPYQFVPLIMALRLKTLRLLVADDVGVGKTIEAGLIARELLDRGEVQRVAVLCPASLCDQWEQELREKFHIEAVVIRSGTVPRLERQTPPDTSIFDHYQHFVASIDTVKGERYRASFLQRCPSLVIVDEVHGAARAPGASHKRGQQQRYDLLRALADDAERHLILLTATPYSGVDSAFLSLLGLLQDRFEGLSLTQMRGEERQDLARHFVQRRRADVKLWMGKETRFPERDTKDGEQPYHFSEEYGQFYRNVYDFARDLVRSGDALKGWKRRMRYWSALALMRCVTSSPAAAAVALAKRAGETEASWGGGVDALEGIADEDLDDVFRPSVMDPFDVESVADVLPSAVFEAQEQDVNWTEGDRQKLRRFAREARDLMGMADTKLSKLLEVIGDLKRQGYQPIVWCRYIATAEYVAEALERQLTSEYPALRVASVTGARPPGERRLVVEELGKARQRVLVATDCLSEGVNLQEHFDAVIHYDLPWNPNRLEQREGRVDRFGQRSKQVKAILIYGQDNPVDGAVLDVLLRKAREIRRTLGIHVPLPMNSETIMESVLRSLFRRSRYDAMQLSFEELIQVDDDQVDVDKLHREWSRSAEREKVSRTRFSQQGIKPEEVSRELEETDSVLGDPKAVQDFLTEASQRLSFGFHKSKKGYWELNADELPAVVRPAVRLRFADGHGSQCVALDSPTPEGVTYVGRNHVLVEGLAEHVLDMAFHPPDGGVPVARCGVIRTQQVTQRTTLYLLRLRYLQRQGAEGPQALAEETLAWGFSGAPPDIVPLSLEDAASLLDAASPAANVSAAEKREVLSTVISWWDALQPELANLMGERAKRLAEAHHRVGRLLKEGAMRIEPQMPPDLLGVLVMLPVPKGVAS